MVDPDGSASTDVPGLAPEAFAPWAGRRTEGAAAPGPFRYGWLGRWFLAVQAPGRGRGARTPGIYVPSASDVDAAVAWARFETVQVRFGAVIEAADGGDLARVRVPSPALALLRLPVGIWRLALPLHTLRHLAQARRVRDDARFPAACAGTRGRTTRRSPPRRRRSRGGSRPAAGAAPALRRCRARRWGWHPCQRRPPRPPRPPAQSREDLVLVAAAEAEEEEGVLVELLAEQVAGGDDVLAHGDLVRAVAVEAQVVGRRREERGPGLGEDLVDVVGHFAGEEAGGEVGAARQGGEHALPTGVGEGREADGDAVGRAA